MGRTEVLQGVPQMRFEGLLDRHERGELSATSELAFYLDWPGAAQVCRIHRIREIAGRQSGETVYALSSLSGERASPAALLALNRRHWGIENQLHWRRDTAFAEDASQIRTDNAPHALAALRNTVLRLLRPFHRPVRASRQTSPKIASTPSPWPFRAFFE